jgi:hypothetical protein
MPANYRDNAENCDELARGADGPNRKRLQRLARGWRAVAQTQEWLDGRIVRVGTGLDTEPRDQDPSESARDDPRWKADWPNTRQSDEPWKGNPEKEQFGPNRPKPDLEKWQETNTH